VSTPTFVIVPAASAIQVSSYATSVDAHYGLPSGVGTPAYTKTYAHQATSLDNTQIAYLYDAVTQPVIDPTKVLVAVPLPATGWVTVFVPTATAVQTAL
jgi:hypothetical protein